MKLRDFREFMYADLLDPEFRRGFIEAYYEQDGVPGIHFALQAIAEADLYAKTGVLRPETPRPTKRTVSHTGAVRRAKPKRILNDADVLRNKLQAHGLDFALTVKSAA